MADKDQWDVLEVDELNIQKPCSASMKQDHVFWALLVPLITKIALFGDLHIGIWHFLFNSTYNFCKLIGAHSDHLLNANESCSEHTLFYTLS